MKTCKICETQKEKSEFYINEKSFRCKECEKARKRKERTIRDHHHMDRKKMLKYHYGITPEDYVNMLHKQKGVCAICGQDNPVHRGNMCVDHSHTTGKVRGLLCHTCNITLGYMKDDVNLLLNAIRYLKEYED